VEPGPEAEALLDAIEARLLSLPDPQGRGRLVDAVFRGPQLYAGARAVDAPDLVVVSNSYRYMTRSGCEFGPAGVLVGPPAVRHSGNHRMDGILLAAGPGVRDGVDPGPQRLLDVAPTALALLGIEVPRGLDGRPMEALLSCGLGWTDELPERPMGPPGLGAGASAEPGAPTPDALERQLRALGYVAGPP
jgi:predicted AlkP superfamily phosphohydrolase/phosphomutase